MNLLQASYNTYLRDGMNNNENQQMLPLKILSHLTCEDHIKKKTESNSSKEKESCQKSPHLTLKNQIRVEIQLKGRNDVQVNSDCRTGN